MKGGDGRRPGWKRLLPWLAAGLGVFALGAALALLYLPEWRSRIPSDPALFEREFRRLATEAGFQLAPGEPKIFLVVRNPVIEETYLVLGERGADWLADGKTVLRIAVLHDALLPGTSFEQELNIDFSLDGRPKRLMWENLGGPFFQPPDEDRYERLAERVARLFLGPGESMGRKNHGPLTGSTWELLEVRGTSPPEHIMIGITAPRSVTVMRGIGHIDNPIVRPDTGFRRMLFSGLLVLPIAIAVVGVFLALLLRARIDLINGAVLGLLSLLSTTPRWFFKYLHASPWLTGAGWLFGAPGQAVATFLTWSAGESLLRSTHPGFTTSLDTLRRGRLGPRGGRAFLVGFAAGAALAGYHLGVYALSVPLPGLSPAGSSLALPVFHIYGSPIQDGISLAAGVMLALALAVRLLPARWSPWAAALLAGYSLSPLAIFPYPAELAANVVLAALLVWLCRRFGVTALLVASVVSRLLPAALFSGLYRDWMPVTFAVAAGLSLLLPILGFVGLARPETVENIHIPPPAFMRRLAEERRLRHEVDLLSRMQVGLLPQEMPRVEGYEITARSMLASEAGGDLYDFLRDDAGRLWIAAGDVAGHGYSCAVAQAMVKAGLLSLIEPGESPAGVLRQLDRVLRGVSSDHSFTSLALVRLDPGTGEAVLANAGYPYPLVWSAGEVREIEIPSLPLGRGPAHAFAEQSFDLPSGSVLLLCSDGLFEGLDRHGNAYGFERAREVLRAMGHRPAVEILDALLNDSRRHLGSEKPPDDVTIVVVRRG
ncbi:MAG TPA: PP2C family protein-serine/threonine phosphatase [Thermoanaerobaculia bacterium]